MDQTKLTVRDVKRLMEARPEPLPPPPPQPAIEYPVRTDPEPQPESPGGGINTAFWSFLFKFVEIHGIIIVYYPNI